MKKILIILSVVFTLNSCTNDVEFNDASFQGLKDNLTWRAIDTRVSLNADGSMTVEAFTEFEVVTFRVSSAAVGTRTFGINNNNRASYAINIDNVENFYTTGTNLGSGELKITESPLVTGKLSGTFKFRALDENGEDVSITFGKIYSIPIQ